MDFVTCKLCDKQLKQITNTHLKSHSMTPDEYIQMFPKADLISPNARRRMQEHAIKHNALRKGVPRSDKDKAAISRARKGQPSHNKGKPLSEETKALLSKLAKERKTPIKVYERTPEFRKKMSELFTGRKVGSEGALKAVATKRARGYDMGTMRGRKLSVETRKKISEASLRNAPDRNITRQYMVERIEEAGLILLNSITENKFDLRCKTCNYTFTRTPQVFFNSKFKPNMCDQCFPISPVSKAENEVSEYIASIYSGTIRRSDMEIISPLELDIVLPDLKLAFEYCGIYWHSEKAGKKPFYHRCKMENCQAAGYRLVTIFEDEWVNNRSIVESMIAEILGVDISNIDSDDCIVRQIDNQAGLDFVSQNSIENMEVASFASLHYGLYHADELVSVMSFSNPASTRSSGWEIGRFCSARNANINGASGKLFKQFVIDNNPQEVVGYVDLRWGNGSAYGDIGFEHVGNTVPNYWYFRSGEIKRYHRYGLRKNSTDDQTKTEWENRQEQGWNRIWDCGNAKWVWRPN